MNYTTPNSTLVTCGPFAVIPLNPANISSGVHNTIIATIAINAITCPLTILLNILVMVAVKTKRQLRTKSNVVLACLATTDLVVGLVVQPLNLAMYYFIPRGDADNFCSLYKLSMAVSLTCFSVSFNHLFLMVGERYIAIKHPFAHGNIVTEVRIIIAAGVAWLVPIMFRIKGGNQFNVEQLIGIAIVVVYILLVFYLNVAVYRKICSIDHYNTSNQVSLEAKQKALKNKKAFYTTTIILLVIFLCYGPGTTFVVIMILFKHSVTADLAHIAFFVAVLLLILNSLFNPLIYAVRLRHFRVAFIQLLSRKTNPEAKQLERRIFGPRRVGVVATLDKNFEH